MLNHIWLKLIPIICDEVAHFQWILVFCDCLFIKFSEYHSLDYFEIWDIVNSWNYTMNSTNLCLTSYLFAIYYWAGINIFLQFFYKYVRTEAEKIMFFWILVQICDIVNSWNFVMNRSNCIICSTIWRSFLLLYSSIYRKVARSMSTTIYLCYL